MRLRWAACAMVLVCVASVGGAAEVWQKISVPASPDVIAMLLRNGADIEGLHRSGDRVIIHAEGRDVLRWRALGVDIDVVDRDVEATYAERLTKAPRTAGFADGSMGGNFTCTEVLARFETYRKQKPAILSKKTKVGTSVEGRPIWGYKISDNVTTKEDEPKALFDGLTHAREPQGMMCVVYFVKYLVEQYGVDPEATWLVDNREIWIVPVVNPDGYIYNQSYRPNGGGMWRKNRSNNGGTYGVDLNRNFGFAWGYDNIGSSPLPGDETYRGVAPFSEPETVALKRLCEKYPFTTAMNFHSYSDVLLHPWGYINQAPEADLFRRLSKRLAQGTGYPYGTGFDLINYPTNGESCDYMYGDRDIYAWTPEVGSDIDGFWPSPGRIEPLAQLTLPMNIAAAAAAGSFVSVESSTLRDTNGDSALNSGEKATLELSLTNFGVGAASPKLTATVTAADDKVIVSGTASFTLPSLGTLAKKRRTISVTGGTISSWGMGRIKVQYKEGGKVIRTDTVSIPVAP